MSGYRIVRRTHNFSGIGVCRGEVEQWTVLYDDDSWLPGIGFDTKKEAQQFVRELKAAERAGRKERGEKA